MEGLKLDLVGKLIEFLQTESAQRGFDRVVLGLSGGVDSAVVGVLCQKAFKSKCHALIMPASSSNPSSKTDALLLCEHFSIAYKEQSIAPYQKVFDALNSSASLGRQGNFCARMRMIMLYDYSLTHHALVVGTSNKSERMLGYGTIFGDLACAINPIGDLFKTQVYALARMLDIPATILHKSPSADFYTGQSDELELGFSYTQIDPLLLEISQRWALAEEIDTALLVQLGYDPLLVQSIVKRVQQNAFKLQLPVIYPLP